MAGRPGSQGFWRFGGTGWLPFSILLASALAGCTVGPDYKRPGVEAPPAWRYAAETTGSLADLGWWEVFQDAVLQGYIRTALEENKDLQVAVARVAEARAQL